MEAVNLLPEYARPRHGLAAAGSELNARKIIQIGGTVAVVLALLFGLLYFRERSVVSDKKSELNTAQAHLVAQEARAKPIKDAQAANEARLSAMRSVITTRVKWDSVLGDLGRDLPTGVSLTSLSAAAAGSSATSTFSLQGTASSHDRVALVLDRLALLPWLSSITLQSSSRGSEGVTFSIDADYTGGGGS